MWPDTLQTEKRRDSVSNSGQRGTFSLLPAPSPLRPKPGALSTASQLRTAPNLSLALGAKGEDGLGCREPPSPPPLSHHAAQQGSGPLQSPRCLLEGFASTASLCPGSEPHPRGANASSQPFTGGPAALQLHCLFSTHLLRSPQEILAKKHRTGLV